MLSAFPPSPFGANPHPGPPRLGEGMFVDLVNAVLAMKVVRTMERGAQAVAVLAALLPAASLRRPRAAARPSARTFRRRCRTSHSRPAFLSDEGDDRTCPLRKGNTRRLASPRLGDALHSQALLRSIPVSTSPRAMATETEPFRDWEWVDGNRNALLFRDRCGSRGRRGRSRSAQRLRLCVDVAAADRCAVVPGEVDGQTEAAA